MTEDEPSAEQAEAEDRIEAFLSAPRVPRQWFDVEGLAGTGKSWLLARIAKRNKGVLCSLTGKAASNLSRRTGLTATTVHSAIYKFLGKDDDDELLFTRNVRDGRWTGRAIFLDEKSMIDETIGRDLLATGARIVAAGDPGQLPPVKDRQFFAGTDFTLSEIRRQAWDSPIIRQAHAVRRGYDYAPDTEDFRVQAFVDRDDILGADIILCWRNATRRAINAMKRLHIGLEGMPTPGEPVMCLKNDHDMGVLNGGVYPLVAIGYDRGDLYVTVTNERGHDVTLERAWFEDFDETNRRFDDSVGFAFSYCATVHKAQGSEFDFVVLVDEYSMREERERWVYTALTRAAKRILVQRNW